jgi:hypothetical protein
MHSWKSESVFKEYIEMHERLNITAINPVEYQFGQGARRRYASDRIMAAFCSLLPYLEEMSEETAAIHKLLSCFATFKENDPSLNPEVAHDSMVPLGEYILWIPVIASSRFPNNPFSLVMAAYLYGSLLVLQDISPSRTASTFAILCVAPILNINSELERRLNDPCTPSVEKEDLDIAVELMHFATDAVKIYKVGHGLALASQMQITEIDEVVETPKVLE